MKPEKEGIPFSNATSARGVRETIKMECRLLLIVPLVTIILGIQHY